MGAHFAFEDNDVKVWKTSLVSNIPDNIEPGKVLYLTNEGPIIKCGEGGICLLATEPNLSLKIGGYL